MKFLSLYSGAGFHDYGFTKAGIEIVGQVPEPKRHAERSAVYRWGMAHPDCALGYRQVFKMTDWISVWNDGTDYIKEGVMVGGKIIGVIDRGDGTALLNVQGTGCEKNDSCAVRCKTDPAVELREGDNVWWQAGKVYWTPGRDRRDYPRRGERPEDVPLEKIGYSH